MGNQQTEMGEPKSNSLRTMISNCGGTQMISYYSYSPSKSTNTSISLQIQ